MYGAKCTMELIGVLPDGWTVSDGCSIMGGPIGRGEAPLEVLDQFKAGYVQAVKAIKACGFDGILTFELNTKSKPDRCENDPYGRMDIRQYFTQAYMRACRVAALKARRRG